MLAGWIWWDDRLNAALREPVTQASCVIGPICQEAAGQPSRRQELAGAGEIVCVAGRDQERKRAPQIICQRVDFGRAPAPRTADRMVEGPPFAPAAERCALICVESMAIVPTIPVEPVSA
jgi:hypothetical protein